MTIVKSTGPSPARKVINWLNSPASASMSISVRVFAAIAPVLGLSIGLSISVLLTR